MLTNLVGIKLGLDVILNPHLQCSQSPLFLSDAQHLKKQGLGLAIAFAKSD